jgi:membrane protease YdiL (CAAX protease family)
MSYAPLFPQALFLTPAGSLHLVLFGVVLPFQAIQAARSMGTRERRLPTRLSHFRAVAVISLALATVSCVVARLQYLPLFPRGIPGVGWGLLAGVAMYGAMLALMWPRWRKAVINREPVVYLFAPENPAERAWWLVTSVVAGVGEEISWRGVQTALLVRLVGSYWPAAVLCAISFGLAHAIQGWKSSAAIVALALGFQAVVAASGSLYIAMAVHVAYDITAGLRYGQLSRELGYAPGPGA